MADGQGDVAGTEADPLPGEERSDLEEGGELEEEEEEDDVDGLASFLESEILSGSDAGDPLDQQQQEEDEEEKGEQVEGDASKNKRKQDSLSDGDGGDGGSGGEGEQNKRLRRGEMRGKAKGKAVAPQIDTGMFSYTPPELFLQIFKFLSSEDLISCALVCRFMNAAASDETLWQRLYCMRWGLDLNFKLTECAWKTLYILRDREEYPYRFRGVLYPDAGCKKESSAPSVRTRTYMLGYNCTDEKELEDALRFC